MVLCSNTNIEESPMVVDNTALFCCLDNFVQVYEEWERHKLIASGRKAFAQASFACP
jgi:hypothetical protein